MSFVLWPISTLNDFHNLFAKWQLYPWFNTTNSGFTKLSFPTLVSKILQYDTWCSYTPLQYHVLYTLSGRGVASYLDVICSLYHSYHLSIPYMYLESLKLVRYP